MSAVPEPVFLLVLGFGMIALSIRVRSRARSRTVAKPVERQASSTDHLGKTVPA